MKKKYHRPVIRQLSLKSTNKHGARTEYKAKTHVDHVAVKDLIQEYGSPLFVISESEIQEKYEEATEAFEQRYPKVQFAWSYKTNYLNAVCNVFHKLGSWAEVVSGFEYDKAIANGVPPEKIIFNGPDKSRSDLEKAVKNDSLIHIDHFEELYLLEEIAGKQAVKPRVAVRVNMDVGVYPLWDRFGFNYENGQAWEAIKKICSKELLNLVGLHTHIGTFMLSAEPYGIATSKVCSLAHRIKSTFKKNLKYIDMGGGFASNNTLKGSFLQGGDSVPTMEDYAEAICEGLLEAGFEKGELPYLYLETGRALIDDAGYLLGSVIANKRLANGRRATVVDFGVNVMFTSFWFNHKVSPAQKFGKHLEDTTLYGPLCMNIDVVREQIMLPSLNVGDNVVVHNMGAYNITQSMQFIALRPAIVLIDKEGESHLIRKREKVEDIERGEVMPSYLKDFDL